jgi:two-component system chemotaxis response regulator CheB
MRGLEETNLLLNEMGMQFKESRLQKLAQALFSKAREVKKRARVVHESVLNQELISGEIPFETKKRIRSPSRKNH